MLRKFIIVLLSSIFALISFELFLKYSPFEYGISPVEYDKQIGMWHKREFENYTIKKEFKNYTIKECYKTKYIFDKQGLPSSINEYDKTKKDVIILGDSYIEAIMVKNKNIIHNSLSKEFNNKYNFMNYGLSGTSPVQQFVILKNKVNLKNTKYVIHFIQLEEDLNEVVSENLDPLARPKVYVEFYNLDEYKIIPPRKKTMYDSIVDFLGNYQMYFFIKKLLYYLRDKLYYLRDNILSKKNNTIKKTINKKVEIDFSKNWLYLKGAIHQINKYIKSTNTNIKYKIIITSKNEKNKMILKKFLESENIEFIFLNDIAKSMNIELKSFECDPHWNDETHRNIAKIIKEIKLIK